MLTKPGWQTSEFWLTILTSLPSIGVLLHVLPAGDQTTIDRLVSQLVAGVVAAVAIWNYLKSRTAVKIAGANVAPPLLTKGP